MIPRFKPWLGIKELLALFRRNQGAVEHFEREFARLFGAKQAVAFPYGRTAVWAFLQAVGIKDAEVVMPAYTCSVVAHAISLSGNRPKFVDIQLTDYNMDLDLLPDAINEHTRAIIATHLFGYPLDLDRVEIIIAEAEKKYGHKIWIIQDCAHSFGASWNGRLVGTSGDVALYALNISKMMTSIFGGMLTFQDEQLAEQVRNWRDDNFKKPSFYKSWLRRIYLFVVYIAFSEPIYGFTYWLQEKTPFLNRLTKTYHLDDKIHFPPDYLDHMLNVEAAVGIEQLKKYPEIVARRRANAAFYDKYLERKSGWVFPPVIDGSTYSHYVVRVPDRKVCIEELARKGVHLGELIQYSVPNLTNYVCAKPYCKNSDTASKYTINIPIYPGLTQRKVRKIANII
jgi:perosamine synthetase